MSKKVCFHDLSPSLLVLMLQLSVFGTSNPVSWMLLMCRLRIHLLRAWYEFLYHFKVIYFFPEVSLNFTEILLDDYNECRNKKYVTCLFHIHTFHSSEEPDFLNAIFNFRNTKYPKFVYRASIYTI